MNMREFKVETPKVIAMVPTISSARFSVKLTMVLNHPIPIHDIHLP